MPRRPRAEPDTSTPLLPHKYAPRSYQQPFWAYMLGGGKRAALVWSRRLGKDTTLLNWTIYAANTLRVGAYYYFYPQYAQAKKAIWEGRNFAGMKFLDHIPQSLVAKTHDTDMRAEFPNGASVQLIGTDNWNSIMGTNPVGVVFSEWSLQDPRAWDYIRPILRENGGWAAFIFTPRGRNHGWTLWERALQNRPRWFTQMVTVAEARRDAPGEDGALVVSPEQIEDERRDGMPEELIQQEYYCSFAGGVHGSYYSKLLEDARRDGRITRVPYDPNFPVVTGWDLGYNDSNAIVFAQVIGKEIRLIDYLEESGEGLPYYARELNNVRPYAYGLHVMPHDIRAHDISTGLERYVTAIKLGINPIEVAPKLSPDEGINAVRQMFPRFVFDEIKCERLLAALQDYHKEWDEENKVFKNKPHHTWASNGADAMRTFCTGYVEPKKGPQVARAAVAFDPYSDAGAETAYDPWRV